MLLSKSEFLNESKNSGHTLEVKFTGLDQHDLEQLQGLFKGIAWGASVGASRDIKLGCDGDGSFRAKITMTPEPSEELTKHYIEKYDEGKLSIGLGC